MKLFIAAACLFVLVVLAFGAGLAYVGYLAKKKVTAVQQAYKRDDLAGMVGAVTGESAKPQPLPDWKPAPASLISSPTSKIPLRVSLRFVHAGSDPLRGDFESIFLVDSVTGQAVHIHASQQFPSGDALDRLLGGSSNKTEQSRTIECGRTVLLADMDKSAEADGYFCREQKEEKHPGTTAMSLSKQTLNELRASGQSEFTFHEDPLKSLFKSFKNAMASGSDAASTQAASNDLIKKMMNFAPGGGFSDEAVTTPAVKCTLRRAGSSDLAFPVLVNDQPTTLPVMDIVLKPPDSDQESHLYVLDDPENPLFMAAASVTGKHEQVVKIYWNVENKQRESQLAQDLEQNKRAKVYDLYFDFRSDKLRPESDKVLKEIAQVMREHPDWKLSVEGNTDNIGGDSFNLDLSKRRAAAVKTALVGDYHVAADRLSTAGFGASRPVDTNDTIEGRARNRRVELARE
jgi:outer membrane protein OmpA-like peptidoglycan-associated protein